MTLATFGLRAPRGPLLGVLAMLALAACNGGEDEAPTSAASTSTGTGGANGGGADLAREVFPDLPALHSRAVARTCSLNDGVCHSEKAYPELSRTVDLVALVGAPCQLGSGDPSLVVDECEVPGDRLVLGGVDDEILFVQAPPDAPYPPKVVQIELAKAPATLDVAGARIRRVGADGAEILSRSLAGATITPIGDPKYSNWIVVDLTNATEAGLGDFLDPRAWHGERVRMGDANGNGVAHAAAEPWAEVHPGDPARSLFYQRLVTDRYGATMPLIQRAWSAAATRAVWCWIRSLPKDATFASVDASAPISYEDCPLDPDAPDEAAKGGWPAVRTLVGSRCATSGCHTKEAKAGLLDLSPDAATFQKQVIDVPSAQAPGVLRVVPGQPNASYLFCKVSPDCAARAKDTALMPLTGMALTNDEIETFSAWISAGAPTE